MSGRSLGKKVIAEGGVFRETAAERAVDRFPLLF
jgi:hypothetical protein